MANSNDYIKNNYRTYLFRIKKNDTQIINKLASVDNKNAYISNLILNDINPSILTIKEIKNKIKPIIEEYDIKDVYLFGSYARGEAHVNSDIDIYCSPGQLKTLFDEITLINKLEIVLHKKVDLITFDTELDVFFKEQLEKDMIKIC